MKKLTDAIWNRVRQRLFHVLSILVYSSSLNGCAMPGFDTIPQTIQAPPAGDLQLVETVANPHAHSGTNVRWGGNVIQIDHDAAGTALIQVIERRLDADGRPIEGSASDGRFLIRATKDVDPQFYARDRLITVAGSIDGSVTTQIGAHPLAMPIVKVSEFMLWLPRWRDDPYWHHNDGWFGPHLRIGVGISNFHNSHRR